MVAIIMEASSANLEFLGCFLHSLSILAVYYIDEAIRVVEVMSPQRAKLFLTADIPHSEQHVLVLHFFDIETYMRKKV